MKKYLSVIAVAALLGFSAGTMPSYAGAQASPSMPSPTDEKDKEKDRKPSAPRADDDKSSDKKKDERSGR